MQFFSFQDCLETSLRVNWKLEDLLKDEVFDLSKPWLPSQLSASDQISWLNEEEKRRLTHVEMAAYAHLFGFVEEFITPKMAQLASRKEASQPISFQALTNFATEEVKHIKLFHRIRQMVNDTVGFDLKLLENTREVTEFVLRKNDLAVMMLISSIEWFTQFHYLSAIKEAGDLDPLAKKIFKAHWLEESQHAKMDYIETLQIFANMDDFQKEEAVTDLIQLFQSLDQLLQKQSKYDAENFVVYLGQMVDGMKYLELYENILKTKRWVFIESGITHPNFVELFNFVFNPSQRERMRKVLINTSFHSQ